MSKNILLVEDHDAIRDGIKRIVLRVGHRCEAVANGSLALKAYANKAPDLILMDYQMPEMNGIDATIEIRTLEKKQGLQPVPIIGITANAEAGPACIQAGMNDILCKPFSRSELAAVLSRHFR